MVAARFVSVGEGDKENPANISDNQLIIWKKEATACGRPIVTTDVPGCGEIVEDGLNGFLVALFDVAALAMAFKKLIISPDLRKEMGLAERKLAEVEFSFQKIKIEIMYVYSELLL